MTSAETAKQAARRLSAPAIRDGYKPEALHAYTNSDGIPLHYRIRARHPESKDKWIRPMRLNGDGYELKEPEYADGKPLYRLHELIARQDEPVIVVEGEWAADALAKRGLLVTTSGGAQSAETADWNPISGRKVIIWPDNDDAGQSYGKSVEKALLALNCDIRVINVEDLVLPAKGDAVDWLDAHQNATGSDILALPCRSDNSSEQGANSADTTVTSNWNPPLAIIAKIAVAPYPVDALPATLRAAVEEVQGFVKAPVPLVAGSALSALSVVIQAHYDVKRAEKLEGPTGIFLLTIADSGERKTTCDGFFSAAIREWEKEKIEAAKPEVADYKAEIDAWSAARSGILDSIRQKRKKGESTSAAEDELKAYEAQKPEPPKIPRLIRGDETPENLAWSLAKEWPSAGVISNEAGVVFGAHGMGKESIMRNLSLLNILWDGGRLSVGRRTSESFTVSNARLTVALQVQGATLSTFFEQSKGLARGSGFLARFLMACPESTQGTRAFTEAPSNWPALASFNKRLTLLLNQPANLDEQGGLSPETLYLSSEAKAYWIRFHDLVESELRSDGEMHDIRDVASKAADNAVRLAALFHVFEEATGAISTEHLETACRIVAWHLHESRRFFGEISMPPNLLNAIQLEEWLIAYCRREQTTRVHTQEVQQRGPNGIRKRADIESAVLELEEYERARLVKEGRSKYIEINPALIHGESA